jgi:ketosteroid isomerase-like protein
VRVYGDAAVMTGTLRNELPAAAGAEPIVMEGHALSVWTRTASGWRQVAFASSARMPEGV